jgi:hypothetical protein
MTRRDSTIEERAEPSLIFFRRATAAAPVELVVVEKEGESVRTFIWPVPPQQIMQAVADLAAFEATRR